jgi:hypothetical protein
MERRGGKRRKAREVHPESRRTRSLIREAKERKYRKR